MLKKKNSLANYNMPIIRKMGRKAYLFDLSEN